MPCECKFIDLPDDPDAKCQYCWREAVKERDSLRLQIHAMADALRDYGQHLPSCPIKECTCGFGYLTFGGLVKSKSGMDVKKICPSTYRQGEFKCEKDAEHLNRIGDVPHQGGGQTWLTI